MNQTHMRIDQDSFQSSISNCVCVVCHELAVLMILLLKLSITISNFRVKGLEVSYHVG